jgi:hypothetical protein
LEGIIKIVYEFRNAINFFNILPFTPNLGTSQSVFGEITIVDVPSDSGGKIFRSSPQQHRNNQSYSCSQGALENLLPALLQELHRPIFAQAVRVPLIGRRVDDDH